MKGLPVFYGSPVSSYADRHLNLLGLGNLQALSHRPDLNELACVRFRCDFGRQAVYTVPQASEGEHEKYQISGQSGGRVLFSGNDSVSDLLSKIAGGAEVKSTELTTEFDMEAHRDGIISSLRPTTGSCTSRWQTPSCRSGRDRSSRPWFRSRSSWCRAPTA